MTGCYPPRVGLGRGSRHAVLLAPDAHGLNPDEFTMAEMFKSRGYATAMFGKWHLGDQPKFLPTEHGFDVYYGIPYSNDVHPSLKRYDFPPLPMLEGQQVVEVDPPQDQFTRRFTERTIEFIRAHRDEPFFVYLAHPMPHRPIHASEPFFEKLPESVRRGVKGPMDKPSRDAVLPASLAEIDHGVGRILDTLDALGLDENTLVVYASDNGPAAGSSGPLRGSKGSIREGGVRVPCVIRWPGTISPGVTIDGVTTTMDWLPTFAAMAGAELPDDRVIDGVNLLPLLKGQVDQSPRRTFFYFQGGRLGAVRHGAYKLIGDQLFNLEDDLGERRNIASKHPNIVAELRQRMRQMNQDIQSNSRPVGRVTDPQPLVRSVK